MLVGIVTADAQQRALYYSEFANSNFYKSSQVISANTVIDISEFTTVYSITSLAQDAGWTALPAAGLAGARLSVTTCGGYNIPNHTYYTPTAYNSSGTSFNASYNPLLTSAQTVVFSFGSTPISNDPFGFISGGANGNNTIDQNYKIFYVHKDLNGNILRNGTAVSLASYQGGTSTSGINNASNVWSIAANIVFDQEFDTPPLIFIKETTNPIALHQFKRNANGKYIGAVVVSYSTLIPDSRSAELYGYSYSGPTTASFIYYIVSQEIPISTQTESFGMKVFNANQEVVFDSSQFVTSFFSTEIPIPYFRWEAGTSSYSRTLTTVNNRYLNVSGKLGLCINNCTSITGVVRYICYKLAYGFGPVYMANAPASFFGTYLYIEPPNALGEAYAQITVEGTSGISALSDDYFAFGDAAWRAWDFRLQNTTTMNVVGAYYDYYNA